MIIFHRLRFGWLPRLRHLVIAPTLPSPLVPQPRLEPARLELVDACAARRLSRAIRSANRSRCLGSDSQQMLGRDASGIIARPKSQRAVLSILSRQ